MTKAKTYVYQIQYKDQTYRIVDWTSSEFSEVGEAMKGGFEVCVLKDGVFRLDDIRVIILVPEVEQPTEEPKKEGELTEWGFVDPESAEWLREQGIIEGGSGK